jgi:ASC-1-like (ASCH) protein
MVRSHLVILRRAYLNEILAGRKKVESRFTRSRRAPFGRIGVGDRLFLKLSSGPVCARAFAEKVLEFENLSTSRMKQLKRKYNGLILGSEEYWADKRGSRYGVLVWLDGVRRIEPVRIDKRDWRAWVVLDDKEDFGLL